MKTTKTTTTQPPRRTWTPEEEREHELRASAYQVEYGRKNALEGLESAVETMERAIADARRELERGRAAGQDLVETAGAVMRAIAWGQANASMGIDQAIRYGAQARQAEMLTGVHAADIAARGIAAAAEAA